MCVFCTPLDGSHYRTVFSAEAFASKTVEVVSFLAFLTLITRRPLNAGRSQGIDHTFPTCLFLNFLFSACRFPTFCSLSLAATGLCLLWDYFFFSDCICCYSAESATISFLLGFSVGQCLFNTEFLRQFCIFYLDALWIESSDLGKWDAFAFFRRI